MTVRALAPVLTVVLALSLGACGNGAEPEADNAATVISDKTLAPLRTQAALRPCPVSTSHAGDLPRLTLACLGGGQPVHLARIGRPTVINLWASWCGPCAEELPIFAAVEVDAVDRVQFLGVDTADREDAGLRTLIDAGVHFPSVSDPQRQVQKELGLSGLPATIFVRADGSIAHTKFGAVADTAELRKLLRTHLGVAT